MAIGSGGNLTQIPRTVSIQIHFFSFSEIIKNNKMVTVTEEERDAYFKHSYKVAFWNGAKVGLISLAAVGLFTYLAKPRSC